MTAQRIFMLLAAVMLVAAFALAVLGPQDMTLGEGLLLLDHTLLARIRGAVVSTLSQGWWDHLAVPVLIRPAWLPAAAVGLIFAGCALTMGGGPASNTRRRRS
ncbi:MAG: hypothetical protein ACRYHQ_20700 [Janthinobacterium lividum]